MEIIKPNHLISREAVKSDIPCILEQSNGMIELCSKPLGKKTGALAIAHCQVNQDDPIQFFVTSLGEIIINPKIMLRIGDKVRRVEGCMSFPSLDDITVPRHEDIEVSYDKIIGSEFEKFHVRLKGVMARVFQYEIEHFRGVNIYGR